jgi:hypothetical protein
MAEQVKIYGSFKDLNDNVYTINIIEDSETALTPQLCEIADTFVTRYIDIANKFTAVRGSISEFALLSVTDRQFIGLYTANIKQYKVNFYKGAAIIWTGWIDSERYSEPFNEIENYPVTIAANDGFNLLDRLDYIQSNGANYYGIVSQWTVLTNILSKLGLSWNNLLIGLSTTINADAMAAGETIFHKQHVNQSNYYNEDGDPETCRTVLEALLKPLGAFIQQVNGNLYITDVNHLAQDTAISFKKYNPVTFAYVSTDTVNQNIGDLTDIEFADSNQVLDTISGVNKQIVSYSPYVNTLPVKHEPGTDDFIGEDVTTNYGAGLYTWKQVTYLTSKYWDKYNLGSFCRAEATAGSNNGEKNYFLKVGKYAFGDLAESKLSFKTKLQLPHILPSQHYLRVNVTANFRTKTDWENPAETGTKITMGMLRMYVKIGTQKRKKQAFSNNWELATSLVPFELYFFTPERIDPDAAHDFAIYYANIADTDIASTNLKIYSENNYTQDPILIPLVNGGIFTGGIIEVGIYDFQTTNRGYNYQNQLYDGFADSATIECRIKDIEFSITDGKGNLVNTNDKEYVAKLNPLFANKGETVNLIHGASPYQISTERGALLGYKNNAYYFISQWIREGVTDKIENLLLRSIVSNYTEPSVKLPCKINMPSSILGFLTYENFLSGKKLMVAGATLNYAEAEADVTLIEISKDNLTIV